MTPCFECGKPASHNHHVVPVVYGGTKTVPLCVDCHSLIHGPKMAAPALIKAGIAKARAAGKKWGGSKKGKFKRRTPELDQQVRDMKASGVGVSEIARLAGLSRPTVYEILSVTEPRD